MSESLFNVNFCHYKVYSSNFTFNLLLNDHLNAIIINEMRLLHLIITLTDFNDI